MNSVRVTFFWRSLKGLEDEQQEEGQLLGQYVYEEDGDALQTYPVMVRAAHDIF